MHRYTPAGSAMRSYSSGGARSLIDEINDKGTMQENKSSFMKGESRSDIESPQNYGFTSVVHKADKDANGQITGNLNYDLDLFGKNRAAFAAATSEADAARIDVEAARLTLTSAIASAYANLVQLTADRAAAPVGFDCSPLVTVERYYPSII